MCVTVCVTVCVMLINQDLLTAQYVMALASSQRGVQTLSLSCYSQVLVTLTISNTNNTLIILFIFYMLADANYLC